MYELGWGMELEISLIWEGYIKCPGLLSLIPVEPRVPMLHSRLTVSADRTPWHQLASLISACCLWPWLLPTHQLIHPDFLFLPASFVFPDHLSYFSMLPCSNHSSRCVIPLPFQKVYPKEKNMFGPTAQRPVGNNGNSPCLREKLSDLEWKDRDNGMHVCRKRLRIYNYSSRLNNSKN